ncbi:MAG: hypothetical protein GX622_12090 [Bacteroidales bacterium]|jgi:hypothetical protein|nr:hypothetical protein [Bacteroidales bacterium]
MKRIIFLTTVVALLFSCSKTDIDEPFSGIDLKAKKVGPEVFVVTPGGVDDTPALCQAFDDAKAAGPGSVVKLVEGEYHVGYMEVYDFFGSLKGAGKGRTIITVLPGMDIDALWAQGLVGCQIKFVGGDVYLSHFTIQTPPGPLSTGGPGTGYIYSLLNFSSFNAVYELGNESRSINVVIDNVSFKGQRMEAGGYEGYAGYNYNCAIAVRTGLDCFPRTYSGPGVPREKIDFKITNCDFDTFCYGVALEGMQDCMATIGKQNQGNTFNNIDQGGGLFDSRNMRLLVEGNTFNVPPGSYGWDVADYQYGMPFESKPETEVTICSIQNNVFNLVNSFYGMYFYNERQFLYGEKPIALQIKNNQFNMSEIPQYCLYSVATEGMVIRNNKFCGHGYRALHLVTYSSNGLVLGNNFTNAEMDNAVAYLSASTKDWTFVGGNLGEMVINYGTNNIFTGYNVNQSEAPFGQTIVDNLQATKEALLKLKMH